MSQADKYKVPRYRIVRESSTSFIVSPNMNNPIMKKRMMQKFEETNIQKGVEPVTNEDKEEIEGSLKELKDDKDKDIAKSVSKLQASKRPTSEYMIKNVSHPVSKSVPRIRFRLLSAQNSNPKNDASGKVKNIMLDERGFQSVLKMMGQDHNPKIVQTPSQLKNVSLTKEKTRDNIHPKQTGIKLLNRKDFEFDNEIKIKDFAKKLDLVKNLERVKIEPNLKTKSSPNITKRIDSKRPKQLKIEEPLKETDETRVISPKEKDFLNSSPLSPLSRKGTAKDYDSPFTMDGNLKIKSLITDRWVEGLKQRMNSSVRLSALDRKKTGPLFLKYKYYVRDMKEILSMRGQYGNEFNLKVKVAITASLDQLRVMHGSFAIVQHARNRYDSWDKDYKVKYQPSKMG